MTLTEQGNIFSSFKLEEVTPTRIIFPPAKMVAGPKNFTFIVVSLRIVFCGMYDWFQALCTSVENRNEFLFYKMATRAKFARLAHYSHQFGEASHIFLKNGLWGMSASLANF
jgi:hypothetical protein